MEINQIFLLGHTIPFLEINNEGSKRVGNNWLTHGCLGSYLEGLDPILLDVCTPAMKLCNLHFISKRLRINKRGERSQEK